MSGTPTLLKVLEYLRESKKPHTREDITRVIRKSQIQVTKALDKLCQKGMISSREQCYVYEDTPKAENFLKKMKAVYCQVANQPRLELVVRGLLSQLPLGYLLRLENVLELLGKENISREEAKIFLAKETEAGYLRQVKVIYTGVTPTIPPLYIPSYYISQLRDVNSSEYDKVKRQCHSRGEAFHEEDYLMGKYPPELAEPAREGFEKEKKEVVELLKEQALSQWPRFRREW